jgi:NTP pyrophosphatase (non-canonical NTP hydrolase)
MEREMNAPEYQNLAGRTLIDRPDFEITDADVLIVWNAIGLAGEAGEVADLVKKGIFHQHGLDVVKLEQELGDVLWYVAAICSKLGLDLGDVMAKNIEKLKQRYPDGYTSDASQHRVDTSTTFDHERIVDGMDGGGWRQFLNDQPIHAGDGLDLRRGHVWIAGRYEMDYHRREGYFTWLAGGREFMRVIDDSMRFRWPLAHP